MVIINRVIKGYEHRCVSLDNQKGTYLATEMLIRYGHQHIAYIGSNHAIFDEVERRNGYLAALKDHNYPIIEQAITLNSPDFEGGEKAMIDLLSYNKILRLSLLITIQWRREPFQFSMKTISAYQANFQLLVLMICRLPVI